METTISTEQNWQTTRLLRYYFTRAKVQTVENVNERSGSTCQDGDPEIYPLSSPWAKMTRWRRWFIVRGGGGHDVDLPIASNPSAAGAQGQPRAVSRGQPGSSMTPTSCTTANMHRLFCSTSQHQLQSKMPILDSEEGPGTRVVRIR